VVSLPSWEVFDEQLPAYRDSVLPRGVPRVSVEAGITLGWSRYVGSDGESIGVNRFGASAPGPVVMHELGMTVEHVIESVERVLAAGDRGGAP
jgi:transketolase